MSTVITVDISGNATTREETSAEKTAREATASVVEAGRAKRDAVAGRAAAIAAKCRAFAVTGTGQPTVREMAGLLAWLFYADRAEDQ